ncbi:MAG: family transporter protein [Nocardioides sp.]|jgi:ABC-2 type transport system permease protein|nr:family transporter protein [Nocardioides sp.]
MMRLVGVELTRLRWRRAVLLLVGAAIVIPLVILAVRAYETRPVSDGDRADAEVLAEEQRGYIEQDIQRCLRRPGSYGIAPDRAATQCERRLTYTVDPGDFLYREQLRVGAERSNAGLAVVAVVAVLMLLAGTTYVGHDWNSGSMSNQLLFETRRLRVWAAKAVAVGLLALVVGTVALGLFWGGLLAFAQGRGLDPSGQVVTDIAQQLGRSLLVVVGAAVGGYALTTLFRSTVVTIGILFGVAVAGGVLFGALLPGDALRYEPTTNALALVKGQTTWYVDPPDDCAYSTSGFDPGRCVTEARLTQVGGAVYYAVLLGVIGAGSAASYRRRDVP